MNSNACSKYMLINIHGKCLTISFHSVMVLNQRERGFKKKNIAPFTAGLPAIMTAEPKKDIKIFIAFRSFNEVYKLNPNLFLKKALPTASTSTIICEMFWYACVDMASTTSGQRVDLIQLHIFWKMEKKQVAKSSAQ